MLAHPSREPTQALGGKRSGLLAHAPLWFDWVRELQICLVARAGTRRRALRPEAQAEPAREMSIATKFS
ncbi:hypothetical protein ACFFQF_13275 [Haladaptatus pallidirubidus]|uniref:hypothetical protein n=1 Tax=Haladaptatus pallidirubidus TaxID=1008152 RepID=UPI001D128D7B|nr:hypothetical protein [Haladaptatus pallidirubidus]